MNWASLHSIDGHGAGLCVADQYLAQFSFGATIEFAQFLGKLVKTVVPVSIHFQSSALVALRRQGRFRNLLCCSRRPHISVLISCVRS